MEGCIADFALYQSFIQNCFPESYTQATALKFTMSQLLAEKKKRLTQVKLAESMAEQVLMRMPIRVLAEAELTATH